MQHLTEGLVPVLLAVSSHAASHGQALHLVVALTDLDRVGFKSIHNSTATACFGLPFVHLRTHLRRSRAHGREHQKGWWGPFPASLHQPQRWGGEGQEQQQRGDWMGSKDPALRGDLVCRRVPTCRQSWVDCGGGQGHPYLGSNHHACP